MQNVKCRLQNDSRKSRAIKCDFAAQVNITKGLTRNAIGNYYRSRKMIRPLVRS